MLEKEKEKAKRIVAEIIRLSSAQRCHGKTRLFKAFYFAHLYYAKERGYNLTEWPIVRMPHGPGVDNFNLLMDELVREHIVKVEHEQEGPYQSYCYELIRDNLAALSDEEEIAIKEAVTLVDCKPATELSDLTHERSRAWNRGVNGDELDIYIDLLSDEEYEDLRERQKVVDALVDAVWN